MSKTLVTGATGRLGTNLVKDLTREGREVVALVMPGDALERKLQGLACQIAYADLKDRAAIGAACREVDEIVHCGAVMEDRPAGMDDVGHFDVNTRGTLLLLDAAVAQEVKRFVYVSSTAVFDVFNTPAREMPIRDDSPQRPSTFYGLTKTAAERLVAGYHNQYDLPTVVLRPNYIMACEQAAKGWNVGVVHTILKDWAVDPKNSFHVPGLANPAAPLEALGADPAAPCVPRSADGRPWQWHVTDVRDVMQAVRAALREPDAIGRSFNIAGPLPMDWELAARHLAKKRGQDPVEITIPNSWRFSFDVSGAQGTLGYEPQYGIERMIDDGLAFLEGTDIGVVPAT